MKQTLRSPNGTFWEPFISDQGQVEWLEVVPTADRLNADLRKGTEGSVNEGMRELRKYSTSDLMRELDLRGHPVEEVPTYHQQAVDAAQEVKEMHATAIATAEMVMDALGRALGVKFLGAVVPMLNEGAITSSKVAAGAVLANTEASE